MKNAKSTSSARGPAALIAAVAVAAGAGLAWWWLRGNRTRRGVDEALRSKTQTTGASEKPVKRARKAA